MKLLKCDRIRDGAALVRHLVRESYERRQMMRRNGSFSLETDEARRLQDLERLHGLLTELASDELLGW